MVNNCGGGYIKLYSIYTNLLLLNKYKYNLYTYIYVHNSIT